MSDIIDRRANGRHKSAGNQQRFIRRYKAQIKEAVGRAITNRSITDSDDSTSVTIPSRDLGEPTFSHGKGGVNDIVVPGNKEYVPGDVIARPSGGGGDGSGSGNASKDGSGEDSFRFKLSREEFLELFFEDMELPDLVKTQLSQVAASKRVRAGYSTDGTPSNLSVIRTMRGSIARRIALASPLRGELLSVERTMSEEAQKNAPDTNRLAALSLQIEDLRARIKRVPFLDDFDLRYNSRVTRPRPIAQAVMFCVMDVSGSMDEERKDLAKRFFILLHMFLTKHYERIEIVFIRHHSVADVVDEQRFFHELMTGGTMVSSALELTIEEIGKRFPVDDWNIYVAQASDGDNWGDDNSVCRELLEKKLLPIVQYYTYVEVGQDHPQPLLEMFESMKSTHDNVGSGRLRVKSDVYPALRDLFSRKPIETR